MRREDDIPRSSRPESVWDYPRPPRLEPVEKRLRVVFNSFTIADTLHGQRVLETAHPPVYYFPLADVRIKCLNEASVTSFCEWKGAACYYDINVDGKRVTHGAWAYPHPMPDYVGIKGHFAFYGHLMDACFVGEELARAQPGLFYGGWITNDIVGPFKGAPGTAGW